MDRENALVVTLVIFRKTITPRVLVVRMENIRITSFKHQMNRVEIVPMADIRLLLVYPAQFVAMLVLPGNIPKK